jgi:tRNA-splicing ligase RtcB
MEAIMPEASIRTWLAEPMSHEVSGAIERLRRAPDVQQIAVMPDVHLGADVCIGIAVATASLIYPQAVGGDIGCGMLAIATDAEAAALANPRIAGQVLTDFGRAVPARRRNRRDVIPLQEELSSHTLCKEATLEFATLGSGNHFLELQADEEGRLWLMIHSGSRALGQAVRDRHLARAQLLEAKMRALDANSDAGREYLHDANCARRYADASRRAMAEQAGRVLHARLGARLCCETLITTDHNHVSREHHGGCELWVHRKGAMPARLGEHGVLPGSMGTLSFHVEGRGCADALCSSAHGAGRALSRTEARRTISERELQREMEGVWYDSRLADRLRDEAPSAYKNIRDVLRAQKELVKVTRTLRPVLNYKGL